MADCFASLEGTIMNRRDLLTSAVAGLGVLATNELTSNQSQSQEKEKSKDKKKVKDAVGDICPMYPYMFHGSYTSYYAMKQISTVPECNAPQSLDAGNGLSLGCGGGGCASRSDENSGEDPNRNHKVWKSADDEGADDTKPDTLTLGTKVNLKDDIQIQVEHGGAKPVWVRLFEVEFDPKEHDPTLVDQATSDLLIKQTKTQTTFIGREVKKHLATVGKFGVVTTAQPLLPLAGLKNTYEFDMKKGGITRHFTVLVKK